MQTTHKIIAFSAVFSLLAACGGSTPPATTPTTEDTASTSGAQAGNGNVPQVSQELGSIDPNAVERQFEKLQGKIQGCFKTGLGKVEYLNGDVSVFLRVGTDGSVKYGYFEDSSLGDRDTEKCILSTLTGASWPKPQGGEAEVRKSFGFDAPGDVRAPTAWSGDKIAAALGKAQSQIDGCKAGVSGTFKGAAYVQPDGKKGKVQAVGLAAPSKEGADKIDCLIGVVQGLELPSPGSYAAKVPLGL
ncbi:MAG TPA: AgmX/PglI C-terminal domain-containing protein [Polyangiaceae bacterium]